MPLFLCSFIVPETGEWLAVDPRSALKMVLDKAEKNGWKCMSGAEFEVCPSRCCFQGIRVRGTDLGGIVLSIQRDCFFCRREEICWT